MIINQEFINKKVRYFVLAAGMSLIVLGLLMLTSGWFNNLLLSLISFWKGKPPAPHWLGKLHAIGTEALLSGIVVVAIGWLILPRWNLLVSLLHRDLVLLATSVLAVVILYLPVVLIGHSATIAGERYWWLGDDAMISMRYGRNLANGLGLVWNSSGERVEGYTNFLWTIYMAFVHLLPVPASKTSLVILLTNIILMIATIPIVIRLIRVLNGGALVTAATLVAYVLNKNAMVWTTAGFETTLLTLLFLLSTFRVIKEAQQGKPSLLTFVLIAVMSLVRADAVILSALLYTLSVLLSKNRKLIVVYSAVSLILPIAHEIFRVFYYGDVLPNTAYLKTLNWSGRYIAGLRYVLDFAKHYPIVIGFALVGSLFSKQRPRLYLLAIVLTYMAYVAYVGGDAFQNFRFFVPVLPLLLALAFLGIQSLEFTRLPSYRWSVFGQQGTQLKFVLSILCLVATPLIVPGYSEFLIPNTADIGNVKIGLLLKQNTSPTSKVADFWAGSVFYFSERYAIDLLGKSDRHIAHLPVTSDGTKPGHNKFDFDYSLGTLRPDFVVANFRVPVEEDQMLQMATGDWAFTGQLYFNRVFQAHCLPYPVTIKTWRTVFVCDWSSQIDYKDNWRELPGE
jgi:arabinofuranosyltransferase